MANGVVTSVSNFQRLAREMDPQQARNAKPLLDKVSDDYAYVVSRKKLKFEQ
jgi:hypothetical protein